MPCIFLPRVRKRTETPSDSTGPASASAKLRSQLTTHPQTNYPLWWFGLIFRHSHGFTLGTASVTMPLAGTPERAPTRKPAQSCTRSSSNVQSCQVVGTRGSFRTALLLPLLRGLADVQHGRSPASPPATGPAGSPVGCPASPPARPPARRPGSPPASPPARRPASPPRRRPGRRPGSR